MFAEERQQAIATSVASRGRLTVAQIAVDYEVTTETVRRDLTALERAGVVRRVHGGVVPAEALRIMEAAVSERDSSQAAEKDRIALAALELMPQAHGTVLIDAGTTTVRMAARLPRDLPLSVITHAVPVAARLAGLAHLELRLLPGRVRETTLAAVGADTVEALDGLRADVAFLGANGISGQHGLSTPDADEAAAKRAMVRAAGKIVVLADSSKLGVETTTRFATLGEVDVLITDTGIEAADRAWLEAAGVEVRTA